VTALNTDKQNFGLFTLYPGLSIMKSKVSKKVSKGVKELKQR